MNRRVTICKQAFTLLEVLVAYAVVAAVGGIAIPCYTNARIATNENATVYRLREFSDAALEYRMQFGTFPSSIRQLWDAQLVDVDLALAELGTERAGYVFAYTGGTNSWNMSTSPAAVGISGLRHFYIDESGIIREKVGSPATARDCLLH